MGSFNLYSFFSNRILPQPTAPTKETSSSASSAAHLRFHSDSATASTASIQQLFPCEDRHSFNPHYQHNLHSTSPTYSTPPSLSSSPTNSSPSSITSPSSAAYTSPSTRSYYPSQDQYQQKRGRRQHYNAPGSRAYVYQQQQRSQSRRQLQQRLYHEQDLLEYMDDDLMVDYGSSSTHPRQHSTGMSRVHPSGAILSIARPQQQQQDPFRLSSNGLSLSPTAEYEHGPWGGRSTAGSRPRQLRHVASSSAALSSPSMTAKSSGSSARVGAPVTTTASASPAACEQQSDLVRDHLLPRISELSPQTHMQETMHANTAAHSRGGEDRVNGASGFASVPTALSSLLHSTESIGNSNNNNNHPRGIGMLKSSSASSVVLTGSVFATESSFTSATTSSMPLATASSSSCAKLSLMRIARCSKSQDGWCSNQAGQYTRHYAETRTCIMADGRRNRRL
ncbi:hypothetical protein BGW38_010717 [Lunasporangiospora selenospora]|uniref:Uncharacterized protein n=1 Tax=Lunasporangiospora selenospora TaxID=979761 RepID=A0A9P6KFJ0_9FUNG|nr:hypothetical protein BGW38_010717 [Lunasporangiospora selenospora]